MARDFELHLSLFVVAILCGVYVLYEILAATSGGHPFGHSLGILGSVLMLLTEILYSARKRWRLFAFGQLRHWLSFHIFTGIVGPTLVLMHTGLEFRGLAGFTMLLTVLVVASGFLGRYIYTAVPRTMAGIELSRRELELEALRTRDELKAWAAVKSARVQALVNHELDSSGGMKRQELSSLAFFTYGWHEWRRKIRLRRAIGRLEKEEKHRIGEVEKMLRRQQRLIRQINSLQAVRRLMGLWHTVHVPLGLTLFSAMFIHIFAALYYSGV